MSPSSYGSSERVGEGVERAVEPSGSEEECSSAAASAASSAAAGATESERLEAWRRVGVWRIHSMGRARRDGEGPEFTWRWIRGLWVLRDKAVARLLGESTRALNQWVTRNPEWFPSDFAFWLHPSELAHHFTDAEYRFTSVYVRPPRMFSAAGLLAARLRRRPEEALPLLRSLTALLPLAENAVQLTDPGLAPPPGVFFRPSDGR